MSKKGRTSYSNQSKSIVCLGEEMKMALRAILSDYPDGESAGYGELIDAIPTCGSGEPVGFGGLTEGETRQPARKEAKNRTAYQEFVSECMKGKGIKGFGESATAMKECAAEWQANKR